MASTVRRLLPASLTASHYIFAGVLFLRLVSLIRLSSSPLLFPNGSDMHFYDEWAGRILGGQWTDGHAFYGLPLYAFVLALLYGVFGRNPFVPGLVQSAFDAGTAVLIYKIVTLVLLDRRGWRAGDRWIGAGAAIAWGFFVPAQGYSVILMPTSGFVFVFWLAAWILVQSESRITPARCLWLGLLLGVTAMAVATILFLIPLAVAAIIARISSIRTRLVAILLLLAGVSAGTAPAWIHNYFAAGDRVFLSAHGGINLWLGNNPDATGYPRFPGLHAGQARMLRESIDIAEAARHRSLRRSEVSDYWAEKAWDYIATNPSAWLRLLGRKVSNFWNAFEYDDLGVLAALQRRQIIFPGFHFGLVAVVGLSGLLFSWSMFPRSRWIAVALFLHVAAIIPIFVTERYRLAVVPGLLVFAALGLHQLWLAMVNANYARAGLQLAAIAVSAGVVALPRDDPALWALAAYNAGQDALSVGDLPRAEEQLQRAVARVPDNAEINLALGNLRLAQGNRIEARSSYTAVLRLDPSHKGALNNLGVIALEDGQFAEAKDYFQRAVREDPSNAKTYYLLGKTELALGNIEEAKSAIARAVKLEPDRAEYRQLDAEIQPHGQ